ncbi:tannase/feruloyl esterase family alpha/beta hydrolase [Gordonia sp. NPDC127522]|uniref:tannase/feruloyl esterase family alpha/beta hydrolase n=1 Tax=Gordonia sp. NPDC127522 TaxID=3345390 RepID=UPI0036411360
MPDDVDVENRVLANCDVDTISAALAGFPGVTVTDVSVNRSGTVEIPEHVLGIPGFTAESMPDYCAVHIERACSDKHTEKITVWVPLVWNGRFMGTAGGGNRLTVGLSPLVAAVKNGFSAANTDGAVGGDDRVFDWQFDLSSGANDDVLVDNWVHESTHQMTVIGKAVTAAIHGEAPRVSYFQGGSGGGRQGMASAMLHPDDYDGIWSQMPAMNWTRFIPAELWPALVMKELGVLAVAKLEAFREAAVAEFNAEHGLGWAFIASPDTPSFDPYTVVGQDTSAGPITDNDARVMKTIWDGPHTPDGQRLWFGLRPGVESWGAIAPGLGLCCVKSDADGQLTPDPVPVAVSWFQTWLLEDPTWDWTSLDFDEYARLFEFGQEKFAHVAIDDPDLTAFRDNGSKLLITHGTDDEVIFVQGTCHYYDRLLETMGGFDEVGQFARLLLCSGEGHGFPITDGANIDLAAGMAALMKWVEQGVAPDHIDPVGPAVSDVESARGLVVTYGVKRA